MYLFSSLLYIQPGEKKVFNLCLFSSLLYIQQPGEKKHFAQTVRCTSAFCALLSFGCWWSSPPPHHQQDPHHHCRYHHHYRHHHPHRHHNRHHLSHEPTMINMMIMITIIQTAAELSALARYHILIELLLFAYFSPIATGVIFICLD